MSIYAVNGTELQMAYSLSELVSSAYDIDGVQVFGRSHSVSSNFTRTLLYNLPDIGSTQGIACDSLSQEIAQVNGGKVVMIDISDGSYMQRSTSINLGHAGTAQFAPQKVSVSDLYPPLYVSTQQTYEVSGIPYSVFVEVQVQESTSITSKIYYVPFGDGEDSENGNVLFAFDFDNDIVYAVYFSSYDYSETGTGKITAYRLSDATAFTGGSWSQTPVNGFWIVGNPIQSYDIGFIPRVQAITFFDGLIACLSDYPTNVGAVIFLDPESQSIYLTLDNPQIPSEREGIGFILNPTTNKYDMILSRRTAGINEYYRYQFN